MTTPQPESAPPEWGISDPNSAPAHPQKSFMLPLSGITVEPVVPVLPTTESTPVEPVNPVIDGNQAGLPEIVNEGTTDGITPKTFKLPNSVLQSMQRTVDELNAVTPGHSTHSYGVNLLSRHEELLKADRQSAYYKDNYDQALLKIASLSVQLQQAGHENQELRADLQNARDFVLAHPYTASSPGATRAEPDDVWREKYEALKLEMKLTIEAHEQNLRAVQPLNAFIKALPAVIEELCQEAQKESWVTAEYYQDFYKKLIAPYLI